MRLSQQNYFTTLDNLSLFPKKILHYRCQVWSIINLLKEVSFLQSINTDQVNNKNVKPAIKDTSVEAINYNTMNQGNQLYFMDVDTYKIKKSFFILQDPNNDLRSSMFP